MLSPFASRIITALGLLLIAAALYTLALGNFLAPEMWRQVMSAFSFIGAIISGFFGLAELVGHRKGR